MLPNQTNTTDMKTLKLAIEIAEAPKGIFTAQIKEIRGAIIQAESYKDAIEEIFKQAYLCIRIDSKNFLI